MRLENLVAGTLAERIPDASRVKDLVISGEINGSDMTLLRSLCGCEGSKACPHPPVLEHLSLEEARIVPGGFAEDARAVTGSDEIGNYMFSRSETLRIIILPQTLQRICGRAFFGCRVLEDVRVGDRLREIGEMAFMNCSSLESLTLGTSPLRIERFAFGNCRRLSRITVRATVPPEVDPTAFTCPSGAGCRVMVSDSALNDYREDTAWRTFDLVTENSPEPEPVLEPIPDPTLEEPGFDGPEVEEEVFSEDRSELDQELSLLVAAVEKAAQEKENRPDAWIETMTVRDKYSNVNGESAALLVSCIITRLKGKPVRVEARLYHQDGQPLVDTNNDFCLSGGQVGVETTILPAYDRSQFSKIALSIPYTEFHLGGKPETLEWRISFFAEGEQIGEQSRCPYVWSGSPCVRISSFRLESGTMASVGAYVDGIISFKANNCAGQQGNCVLFLFYEDGRPVKDRNGSYCSIDGQVCASAAFSPKYPSALFSDFRMRLPLNEFHLDGVKAKLKLLVQVFVGETPVAATAPIVINWNH